MALARDTRFSEVTGGAEKNTPIFLIRYDGGGGGGDFFSFFFSLHKKPEFSGFMYSWISSTVFEGADYFRACRHAPILRLYIYIFLHQVLLHKII